MVSNPYECTDKLTNSLLENYFSEPRFLRRNDLFGIDVKEYILDQTYLHTNILIPVIYFKVHSIIVNDSNHCTDRDSCYILRGETTLIQESNVHSYLPEKHTYCDETKAKYIGSYPPCLEAPLEHLKHCVLPFLKSGKNKFCNI